MPRSVGSFSAPTFEVNPSFLKMALGQIDSGFANITSNGSANLTAGDTKEVDESNNVYDAYILYKVTYYMVDYYLWVLLVFGVPGNLASIFTILSMTTVSSSKAHVAILAITDTVAIVVKVIYSQVSGHFVQLTAPGCTLIMFIQQFSTAYANWVVVAMTSERFLAVWFPLRVGRMYTRRKAILTLACLAIITAAVYFFFFWSWTENFEEGYGYWCVMKQDFTVFVNESFYWIEGVYYAILPCFLVLIGNTLIITNIKRAMKIQRHLTNTFDQGGRKSRDQKQITIMLVVVSVIFLLLNMPSAIFYIVRPSWKFEKPSYEHVKYLFTNRFIHVLADANHAVNFYLYFLSMSSFRRRFMDSIKCRGNTYTRPAGGSVSRTSNTFLHGIHLSSDLSRRNNNGVYNTYKPTNKNIENVYPLEAYKSNSNGTNYGLRNQNFRNSITTAISEV